MTSKSIFISLLITSFLISTKFNYTLNSVTNLLDSKSILQTLFVTVTMPSTANDSLFTFLQDAFFNSLYHSINKTGHVVKPQYHIDDSPTCPNLRGVNFFAPMS